MDDKPQVTESKQPRRLRLGFLIHLTAFLAVNALLITLNLRVTPDEIWFQWPLMGWGLGILLHAGLCFALPRRAEDRQRRLAQELRTKRRTKARSHSR